MASSGLVDVCVGIFVILCILSFVFFRYQLYRRWFRVSLVICCLLSLIYVVGAIGTQYTIQLYSRMSLERDSALPWMTNYVAPYVMSLPLQTVNLTKVHILSAKGNESLPQNFFNAAIPSENRVPVTASWIESGHTVTASFWADVVYSASNHRPIMTYRLLTHNLTNGVFPGRYLPEIHLYKP